jgi:ABC-type uncharacterized transport system permease subunit
LLAGLSWERVTRRYAAHVPAGSEILFFVVALALAGTGCLRLEPFLERTVLGGTLPAWLLETFGVVTTSAMRSWSVWRWGSR